MFSFANKEFHNPLHSCNLQLLDYKFPIEDLLNLDILYYLNTVGFVVFENLKEENFESMSIELTKILGNHLIINNRYYTIIENDFSKSKSKYDAYSNNLQPFHVDMRLNTSRINFITMYCLDNSDSGGDALILNSSKFLESLCAKQKLLLDNCFVYYTASKTVKVKLFENNCLNFNPLFNKIEFENEEYLKIFNDIFDFCNKTDSYIKLRLKPKDLIIVNNQNFFHSRTPFEYNSKRKMVRTFHC
jgi:alpha-ketoglutarate-dependent taurine dioxygenase